jgi:hypothetical protein
MRSKWVLGLACLVFVTGLRADPPMTTLSIEVKSSESGKPVERASIVVKFVSGRDKLKLGKKIRTSWETRTNEGGVAKLPPIPQGKILVQVIAKGYQTFGQTFDVDEEEKTIEIKVNPPQPQYTAH